MSRIFSTSPRRHQRPDLEPYFNHARRHQTKDEMAKWAMDRVKSWNRPVYHVVVKMVTDNATKMTNRIDRYRRHVNRQCFGPHWYKRPDDDLMVGIRIYEERGGYLHAHILAAPPINCDIQALLRLTRHLLGQEPTIQEATDDLGYPCWIARTPDHGEVWVQQVRPTDADLRRIVDYVLKGLNFDPHQHQSTERQWAILEEPRR